VATIILMIFLRVLPKNFLWPHYSGPQEIVGPSSFNRLNSRFLCHWKEPNSDNYPKLTFIATLLITSTTVVD